MGGHSVDITPYSVSRPVVCGPQVVCQMSKGLQNDCRQFFGTDISILTHATKERRHQAVGAEGKLRTTCYNSVLCGVVQRCLLLFQRKKEKTGQTSPADPRSPSLHISKDIMKEMMLCPNLLAIVSPTSPRWKATTFHPKGSISKQLVTNSAELASHKLAEQAKSPDKMNHS